LVTYQRSQPVKRCDPVGFHLLSGIGVGQLVLLMVTWIWAAPLG